jgi:hypothetical protein
MLDGQRSVAWCTEQRWPVLDAKGEQSSNLDGDGDGNGVWEVGK